MRVCRVKVRVESEDAYWKGQVQRLKDLEKTIHTGGPARIQGTELVFASLTDMARTLTPKRLDLLRFIRHYHSSSVRELAQIAGRDLKNVLADVKALETLGYSTAFTVIRKPVRFDLVENGRYELPRFDCKDLPPFRHAKELSRHA